MFLKSESKRVARVSYVQYSDFKKYLSKIDVDERRGRVVVVVQIRLILMRYQMSERQDRPTRGEAAGQSDADRF